MKDLTIEEVEALSSAIYSQIDSLNFFIKTFGGNVDEAKQEVKILKKLLKKLDGYKEVR